jgi:hypothetical protein
MRGGEVRGGDLRRDEIKDVKRGGIILGKEKKESGSI